MKVLVGYTGLIGTTLKENIKFDYEFNSFNIDTFLDYDLENYDIYLSCLPATKWLINKNVDHDMKNIHRIINILSRKKYNNIYLFSTIDVYLENCVDGSDEDTYIPFTELNYGNNRLLFELLIKTNLKYNNLKIFRLPALYNKFIKKNIIYDLLNNNNINMINKNTYYQWYNLNNLYKDIEIKYNGDIVNLFTEPVKTLDIIKLFDEYDINIFKNGEIVGYNYRTKYYKSGYINNKENVLEDIKKFINEYRSK